MDTQSMELVRKQFISGQLQPGSILAKLLSDIPENELKTLQVKAAEGMLGIELEKMVQLHRFHSSSVEIREFIENIKELESASRQGFSNRYTAVGEFQTASGKTTITAKKGCFVATAVYQNPDHPNLAMLRSFRDEYLETHFIGRLFCSVYYYIGPVLAASQLTKGVCAKLLRYILDFMVSILSKYFFKQENQH
jgi:hypothetical protein